MAELRQHDVAGARALELLILCASRSGEVLNAKWTEFGDLTQREWTILGERMKAGNAHRVPLSEAAMAILEKQKAIQTNVYVFAGRGSGPAGKDTLGMVLRRLGRHDLTVHGFRSTFADWCADQTNVDARIKEMALAHTVGVVEGAYTRTDLFEKRRALAEAWAAYCAGGEVIAFPVAVQSASD